MPQTLPPDGTCHDQEAYAVDQTAAPPRRNPGRFLPLRVLCGFFILLVLVFCGAYGLGAAVGPVEPGSVGPAEPGGEMRDHHAGVH
ncbi:hypothetical protein DEJ50_07705 [Streptomyces venezuelae]|uniref:Uncharacterized protein n=1 Tax=Streptomyces venezuelae TaxID=54571 RepID=A0A5P2D0Z5_STRVZ|nr:hypothetical protein [Streptomyces venezuelae]QES47718.1 hypothetical protein DEJ50_07705 [Streptomyces venezuelae]